MEWWGYLIIFVGIIAVYMISASITYIFFKKARTRAFDLLDGMIPYERERLDLILETKKTLDDDKRFLPKNMIAETEATEKLFQDPNLDIATCKGHLDYLTIYYCKYIEEKKLGSKNEVYNDLHDKMMSKLRVKIDDDKESPYYIYNKAATKYNAFLNMMLLAIFNVRNKNAVAPIL